MSWGLVLSGGAAFGIANGGVLEVLEREGLKPDCIAGSSMGAIFGACCALGIPVARIRKAIDDLSLLNVARLSDQLLKDGLQGGFLRQELERHVQPLFGDARIADCKIPFVCVAGKLHGPIAWSHIVRKGFRDEFNAAVSFHVFPPETKLMDAVAASSAIPVVFSPISIDGEQYVDLCHFGPIPARALQERFHPDRIVATDTEPMYEKLRKFLPSGWRDFLEAGDEHIALDKAACDLVIGVDPPASLFRFDKGQAFWEAGRRAAEEKLEAMKKLLSKKAS